MYAVDDVAKTKLLLERGADPNLRSGEGRTALMIAVANSGSFPVVKLLLERRRRCQTHASRWAGRIGAGGELVRIRGCCDFCWTGGHLAAPAFGCAVERLPGML